MGIKWITPVSLNLPQQVWGDIDVSPYVSTSCTGVFLHAYNCSGSIGFRKKGSTDTLGTAINSLHIWFGIGVNASKIFQVNIPAGGATVDIVGYTESECVWFDNRISKSLGIAGSYQDVDISADTGADTAIGVFGISPVSYLWGVRKNGSTDDIFLSASSMFFVVGVDASEIFELKLNNVNNPIYLIGYVKTGANAVFLTDTTDLSLGSTGAYADLAALPSTATGGFIEVKGVGTLDFALRKKGSSEDIYVHNGHTAALIECDTNHIIEGKIETTAVDFFLRGYTEPPPITVSGYKSLKGVGI